MKRRNPYARYTRQTIAEQHREKRTGREAGPRASRILLATRSPRAARTEVKNTQRAQWRNFDWCMSRVTNSYEYR